MPRNFIAACVGFICNIVIRVAEVAVKSGETVGNRVVAGDFLSDSAVFFCKIGVYAVCRFTVSFIENSVIRYRFTFYMVRTCYKTLRSAVDIHQQQACFACFGCVFACVLCSLRAFAEFSFESCVVIHFGNGITRREQSVVIASGVILA